MKMNKKKRQADIIPEGSTPKTKKNKKIMFIFGILIIHFYIKKNVSKLYKFTNLLYLIKLSNE